jgi:hypothetical protein
VKPSIRKTGFLILILAGLLFLTGFIPDRSEKVQFNFKGQDMVERIVSDYAETPVFSGREDIKAYLRNSNLVITLQFPKNIMQGRKGHVEVTAHLAALDGEDQITAAPVDFNLQIKAHLEFPRQFVEPAGIYQKTISRQASPAFNWNLMSTRKEPQKGKLWIYLSLKNPQGLSLDYPLVARDLEIPVSKLLGMDLSTSRIVSLCLTVLGSALMAFTKFVRKK